MKKFLGIFNRNAKDMTGLGGSVSDHEMAHVDLGADKVTRQSWWFRKGKKKPEHPWEEDARKRLLASTEELIQLVTARAEIRAEIVEKLAAQAEAMSQQMAAQKAAREKFFASLENLEQQRPEKDAGEKLFASTEHLEQQRPEKGAGEKKPHNPINVMKPIALKKGASANF